ncbi:MAG: SUMF1/EgtB/PvdO family nonheme iron enzyme, partial [Pseudomonadota bacterium]
GLDERSLYVPGQPGSGKTTFCRWVLGVAGGVIPLPSRQSERLPEEFREEVPTNLLGRLPVLIRLRDLADTLAPVERDWSASQFWDALGEWVALKRWGEGTLTRSLFEAHRAAGTLLLLLDGVDEVPIEGPLTTDGRATYPRRALLSGLVNALDEDTSTANRVLLTSRPYGLSTNDEAQLPLDRHTLSALPQALQNGFIDQWFELAMPLEAQETADALRTQLAGRSDLTELQSNPLMLHALCVKFYDGNQLPEDIHDLYASIVSRVLHSRYERDSKEIGAASRRLQVIALDMHTGEYSRQPRTQPMATISFTDVEQALTHFAHDRPFDESAELDADQKLKDLLDRSGLLFSRDQDHAEFAHLMFTYFLASERLRVNKTPLRESLRAYGNAKAWHPTLQFRFAYEARESLQQAMEALNVLAEDVAGAKLANEPHKGALIGLCLEIAQRRGALGEWVRQYRDIAQRALEAAVDTRALAEIYRSLGVMNLDDRPGVGLDEDGVPSPQWVPVPAGSVVLEEHKKLPGVGEYRIEEPFEVSLYPVTHQQFQAFLDADDGYQDEAWWEGLVQEPSPALARYKISNYPRDRVSWYDAVAYCRWLSARVGYEVTLPTEAQWQLAAGGPDGKEYPWGAEWDATAANVWGGAEEECTAVGLWPRDRGVGGACDFAGGLTEWCAPLSGVDSSTRPCRGAAWDDGDQQARRWARCAVRSWGRPDFRGFYLGFRV